MFGRRRKSTKKLEPFAPQSAADAVALRAQLLPTDVQVEEDVRTAPTDDVAFTARVPSLQEVLGGPVSLKSRFEDDDDDNAQEEEELEEEEEEETLEELQTGSDLAPEKNAADGVKGKNSGAGQDDVFVTKVLYANWDN